MKVNKIILIEILLSIVLLVLTAVSMAIIVIPEVEYNQTIQAYNQIQYGDEKDECLKRMPKNYCESILEDGSIVLSWRNIRDNEKVVVRFLDDKVIFKTWL